jgi:hypothetical protein
VTQLCRSPILVLVIGVVVYLCGSAMVVLVIGVVVYCVVLSLWCWCLQSLWFGLGHWLAGSLVGGLLAEVGREKRHTRDAYLFYHGAVHLYVPWYELTCPYRRVRGCCGHYIARARWIDRTAGSTALVECVFPATPSLFLAREAGDATLHIMPWRTSSSAATAG